MRPARTPALRTGLVAFVVVLGATACASRPDIPAGPAPGMASPDHPVVPRPARVEAGPDSFVPGRETAFVVPSTMDPRVRAAAGRLAERFRRVWRLPVAVVPPAGAPAGPSIRLTMDPTVKGGEEAYRLSVDGDGVTLAAPAAAGLFYGLQTLDQLVPEVTPDGGGAPAIAAVEIEDAPRFGYRGLHLDVGRHFFGVEFVKRYLDAMAAYKLNRFHWHLTEDQGWRLEIRRYPRLTEVGACRDETMVGRNFDPYVGDGERYCGYYTQAEAREIVEYARERFITVIPEIEMPGHSLAALAAYPGLACTPGPFEVGTRWGVFEDIYCPSQATFDFLEGVLTEVMDIFPGPYIHIGGDEAPKTRWEESPLAQRIIRREGLDGEAGLQSWFIGRIERFVADHGRRLIGWDEILEGGLPRRAAVMSWRGVAGGIEAAEQGHDVIMTPVSHLYFDYYQGDPAFEPLAIGGFTPLERVYAFEPVPEELGPKAARHVLGPQANVWTEYMQSGDHVEYMVFPRMLALSEVAWSPTAARDWDHFLARLPAQIQRLARLRVNYRLPDVRGVGTDRLTLDDHVTVRLRAPVPGGVIRYTLDGTEPTPASTAYREPLHVRVDSGPVTVAARVLSGSRAGAVRRSTFRRTTLAPALAMPARSLEPGLRRTRVTGAFRSVAELDRGTPVATAVSPALVIPDSVPAADPYGLRFTGYIRVPRDAVYTFRLTSDDGSALFIDHRRVVDNDGLHGPTMVEGQVALAAGLHRFELRFFQAGGGQDLELHVAADDHDPGPVPEIWFHHYPRR
ncbi:MAG: family 20 glycosylhydrolase [Longimicrobiales bacterium]